MTNRPSLEPKSTRTAKDLLLASKEFAHEVRWVSWWHLWSSLAVFAGLIGLTLLDVPWWARVPASIVAGLSFVRIFIVYHDFQHGTILTDSLLASGLMYLYGLLSLNPPSIWKRSHDHHHRNTAKVFGASIGSYPVMTTETFAAATPGQQRAYALSRHPLTMALGYVTIFMYGMCLRPFLLNPLRHFDALVALVLHAALLVALALLAPQALVLTMLLPMATACAMGAYLFYAQHNYPAVKLRDRADWSYVDAALHSSSFIAMSRVMHWFTGNIGYHHVHHLNARIPFYRLPEAMAALTELQSPGTTTLHPVDVLQCLRLKLWDPHLDRMVGFPKPTRAAASP